MVKFAWPWIFLVLPLPLFFYCIFPRAVTTNMVLRVPFAEDFLSVTDSYHRRRFPLIWIPMGAVWILLLTAAARPQWMGNPIETSVSGRDLILAVDLSASMNTSDFHLGQIRASRLDAVKKFAGDFLRRRNGDRVGLILFGRQPYLQAPLTFDRHTVSIFLEQAAVGIAGDETALGDAIGMALKHSSKIAAERKVLVLLSDGANTAGTLAPQQAARLASSQSLIIYTLGVGSESQPEPSLFGKLDRDTSPKVDEALLQDIARETGGRFFRIRNSDELLKVYDLLDQLEPGPGQTPPYRAVRELFFWPLGLAWLVAVFLAVGMLLKET